MKADLSLPESYREEVKAFSPEIVVHLSWQDIPDFSLKKSQDNLNQSLEFLSFVSEIESCKKIIAAGTCLEYNKDHGKCLESELGTAKDHFTWAKHALYSWLSMTCKQKDIQFLSTAFDLESLEFLKQYDLKYNKVASAMLTNMELINKIAQEKKHTFISTGMSNMDQIKTAVNIFKKNECPFELQHSNSSYPMKLEEANLNCIKTLQNEFECNVGYSGHESLGYLICVTAVVLGATSIERHITLDRSMYGSDQPASLEPAGLQRLVRDIRIIDLIMGDGKKIIWDSEIPVMKKLRNM